MSAVMFAWARTWGVRRVMRVRARVCFDAMLCIRAVSSGKNGLPLARRKKLFKYCRIRQTDIYFPT